MATTTNTPRLRNKYKEEVIPALMKRFGYKSVMQVPQLEKIAINRGVNGAVNDKKLIDIAIDELTTLSGQRAVATNSEIIESNSLFTIHYCLPACFFNAGYFSI